MRDSADETGSLLADWQVKAYGLSPDDHNRARVCQLYRNRLFGLPQMAVPQYEKIKFSLKNGYLYKDKSPLCTDSRNRACLYYSRVAQRAIG